MTEKHSRQWQTLVDDISEDYGTGGLTHRVKGLDRKGALLTRSPDRPSVHAGSPCPRCNGQMIKESTLLDGPQLVCVQCGCALPDDVSLTALVELADELTVTDIGRKAAANGRGGRMPGKPSRNGRAL